MRSLKGRPFVLQANVSDEFDIEESGILSPFHSFILAQRLGDGQRTAYCTLGCRAFSKRRRLAGASKTKQTRIIKANSPVAGCGRCIFYPASEERNAVAALFLYSVQHRIRILINACAGVFTVGKRYTHAQRDRWDIPILLR